MDALSDILKTIRLSSSVYFRSDFSAPWGMQIDAGPFAQFHMVVRGNCRLQMDDAETSIGLSSGDIVVFPLGDAHRLGDETGRIYVNGKDVVEAIYRNQPLFQKGPVHTTLVCGHFEFERSFEHPFLQALPRFIHIRDFDRRELSWLETATHVLIHEAGSGNPGADAVVERLAEVMFIQILRAYLRQHEHSNNFLTALKDTRINHALSLLHTDPQISWTLADIAHAVGMSRSAFAVRFKQLVGRTPLDYLTKWRLQKARELLKQRHLPIIEIAEQVGYTSDAAFNRAFKRQFRENPGAVRRRLSVAECQNSNRK